MLTNLVGPKKFLRSIKIYGFKTGILGHLM